MGDQSHARIARECLIIDGSVGVVTDPYRTLTHQFLVPRCGPAAFPIMTLRLA